jgi:hypothetical protein
LLQQLNIRCAGRKKIISDVFGKASSIASNLFETSSWRGRCSLTGPIYRNYVTRDVYSVHLDDKISMIPLLPCRSPLKAGAGSKNLVNSMIQ